MGLTNHKPHHVIMCCKTGNFKKHLNQQIKAFLMICTIEIIMVTMGESQNSLQ